MSNAATVSALLLLALAGGFLLAYLWPLTRYIALRLEGQQFVFMAVAFAVPLVILARLLLLGAPHVFGKGFVSEVTSRWEAIIAPVDTDASTALATFFVAFVLGLALGLLLRVLFGGGWVSDLIIDRYGSGLEKFLYKYIRSPLLISVTLDKRKVYVGYPGLTPMPNPRGGDPENYFGLLPLLSGYRAQDSLQLRFTTDYTQAYEEVDAGMHPDVSIDDFEIIIPLDRVVTVNPFSLEIEQGLFDISSGEARKSTPS